MTEEKRKKVWKQPEVEKIDLEFDKEMSDNCKGSAQASAQHLECGPKAEDQNACWNAKT